MDTHKIQRGGKTITLKKDPNQFAVRLSQGRAMSTASLRAACGASGATVYHVCSIGPKRLDLFYVAEPTELEGVVDRLRAGPSAEIVTHVYSLDDTGGGSVIPTGDITVRFKSGVSSAKREQALADSGLEIVQELDYLPLGYIVRLGPEAKLNPLKICEKLSKQKQLIEIAEPNLAFQRSLKYTPASLVYPNQWHLNNRGDGAGLKSGADVSAEEAWDHTLGDPSITICVIDDGFDLDHPDFDFPGKIVAPYDFGQDDMIPEPVLADDNHGTSCAGVAVAEGLATGSVGLAPKCSLMPLRMGVWLDDDTVEAYFQHAIDNHADVISCSWSAQAWYFPLSVRIDAIIHKAATEGRSNGKGCVILFAAGNEARPLNDLNVPSHQGFALHPAVIAVGASNSLDLHSSYSNFGPELTLCAPSSGSPGRRVTTTDRQGSAGYAAGDFTVSFGGTSSATPLSAALAALILTENPELTSAEVRSIMMETADNIDTQNGNYTNGHSPLYGAGRINAQKALDMVAGTGPTLLPKTLTIEHKINRKIPDLGNVITTIPFPMQVNIAAIEVSVDIRHTWSGDLTLSLLTPYNTQVSLQDQEGGSTHDITRTWRSDDTPGLFSGILGKTAQGDWELQIVDNQSQDDGVLRKWRLSITY